MGTYLLKSFQFFHSFFFCDTLKCKNYVHLICSLNHIFMSGLYKCELEDLKHLLIGIPVNLDYIRIVSFFISSSRFLGCKMQQRMTKWGRRCSLRRYCLHRISTPFCRDLGGLTHNGYFKVWMRTNYLPLALEDICSLVTPSLTGNKIG